MSKSRATLEVIAFTVEEAISNGLAELGLPQEAVEIEVLDEGSKGLFGLGARQARVRLTMKSLDEEMPSPPSEAIIEQPKPEAQKAPEMPVVVEAPIPSHPAPAESSESEEDLTLQVARDTVSDLLERMDVEAQVTASYGEQDERSYRQPILIDIKGEDLSILIGRKAETLNALQYIASLIVNKRLSQPITLIVDVEGYRNRRYQQIRQLARRVADQTVKTSRRQSLEPMPANERRIVHIALRNHPQVRTESMGEDPHRKVIIIPKED